MTTIETAKPVTKADALRELASRTLAKRRFMPFVQRMNPRYLPGVPLHGNVRATARAEDLAGARASLLVVPAQTVRGVLAALSPLAAAGPGVLCAKGIERGLAVAMDPEGFDQPEGQLGRRTALA